MAQRVEVNSHGNQCILYNRGFTSDYLSRTGNLAFWKLAEYITHCRVASLRHKEMLTENGKQLYEHRTGFIVLIDYQMTQEFYRIMREFIETNKLSSKTELLNFKKSSYILETTLFKTISDMPLSTVKVKSVFVDHETRRSVPLPDWFVTKYGRLVKSDENLEDYVSPKVPVDRERVYGKVYVINPSDIDYHQHTNNAVYYRLCFDTATEASLYKCLFKELPGDTCGYDVRRCQGVYMKECRLGDVIEILVWQDLVKMDTLHFHVNKVETVETETKVPLFRTSIQFYLYDSKF